MRKKYVVFLAPLLFCFCSAATAFAASFKKDVRIDNEFVQTYREKQGKWIILNESKFSLEKILKEYGSEEIDVRQINEIGLDASFPKSSPVFFPFGEEYVKNLLTVGKGRDIVISDAREFIWPVSTNSRITSRIGKRWNTLHSGVDIACSKGSVVVAAADGLVISARDSGNFGLSVEIQHDINNIQTMYAHNSRLLIKAGEKVKKGQIIALSGNTGHSTGPHLHFEVKYQNVVLNPEHYLPAFPKESEKLVVMKEENQ